MERLIICDNYNHANKIAPAIDIPRGRNSRWIVNIDDNQVLGFEGQGSLSKYLGKISRDNEYKVIGFKDYAVGEFLNQSLDRPTPVEDFALNTECVLPNGDVGYYYSRYGNKYMVGPKKFSHMEAPTAIMEIMIVEQITFYYPLEDIVYAFSNKKDSSVQIEPLDLSHATKKALIKKIFDIDIYTPIA